MFENIDQLSIRDIQQEKRLFLIVPENEAKDTKKSTLVPVKIARPKEFAKYVDSLDKFDARNHNLETVLKYLPKIDVVEKESFLGIMPHKKHTVEPIALLSYRQIAQLRGDLVGNIMKLLS